MFIAQCKIHIMKNEEVFPVSCNRDCGGGCALEAHVKNGKITKITDSRYKPSYMRGCIKGYRMADALYSSERLTKPLIRTGDRGSGDFREIPWDEVLDIAADKLRFFKDKYGAFSVMRIGGSGSCRGALHNSTLLTQRSLSLFGGYTETDGSFSSEASDFVKPHMFGTKYVGIDVKTLFNSKLVILWGMNPEETRMGAETENVFAEISRRGTPIVVVDPRKTASVRKYNAKWFPVLPGTDSVLMLAVLYLLIRDFRADLDYMEKYSTGFGKLSDYVTGKTDGIPKDPRWASEICGLPAERIEEFASIYSEAKPAALLSGLSVQRTIGGENTDRLGAVLQLATGNFGVPGGSPGCGQWNRVEKPVCGEIQVPENSSVVRVPVYLWADAVLEGTAGGYPSDIRMLYNVGGNYLGQGSDVAKTAEAFKKADFIVTHDYFLTPAARFSDLVFPVTTFLERDDILFSNSRYLLYSRKVSPVAGESRNDYRIFADLAERFGFYEEFTEGRSERQWLDYFIENSEISDPVEFTLTGIYTADRQDYIGLSYFFRDPERSPLSTPSGKIEIEIEKFAEIGGTRIPEEVVMKTSSEFPLRLLTPHEKYRIHSQFDNIPGIRKMTDRSLWLNPEDAAARGIGNGSKVIIKSPEGYVITEARVTSKIMKGAVSMNQGGWIYGNKPGSLEGANPNFLTTTVPAMPSRGSRTHSTAVQVERV